MFRATTGYSPHQFVLLRRVERARLLLTTTDLPLVEVAHLSGFADQSHLARHTRRLFGLTPASLRRLGV
jgi:AraC family transcriptional regulator